MGKYDVLCLRYDVGDRDIMLGEKYICPHWEVLAIVTPVREVDRVNGRRVYQCIVGKSLPNQKSSYYKQGDFVDVYCGFLIPRNRLLRASERL